MQVDNKIEYDESDFNDEYKVCYKKIINYLKSQSLNSELENLCSEEIIKELYRCQIRRYPLHLVIDDVCEFCNNYIRKNRHLQDIRVVVSKYIGKLILLLILIIASESAIMKHLFWDDYFYVGTFSLSFLLLTFLFYFFKKQLAVLLIHRYKTYNVLSILLAIVFTFSIAFVPEQIANMYNYFILIDSRVLYLLLIAYLSTLLYRLVIARKKPQRN